MSKLGIAGFIIFLLFSSLSFSLIIGIKDEADLKEYEKDLIDFNDKLTKAKEHIENLLYYVKQCTCERSNYAEIEEDIKQAEQFISEVEK